ncbi:Inhibitor I9 domain-containing protein [Psidium guajava]|nr:Inhibitor I9 domain-containing protein [Psidium guajava]
MLRITTAPFLVLLLSISAFSSFAVSMADREVAVESGGEPSKAEVHIVYTEKPEGDEPEAVHLRTLSTVLGSVEAAKESLLYVYKNAATGFSAKLTPEQVAELSKQPGVLQVVPNMKLQLHSGPGRLH